MRMSCEYVQERMSLLLDCNLPVAEREHVLAHLEACGKCGERFESMQSMRSSLRDLSRPRVPSSLSTQLRVIASHERSRLLARKSLAARLDSVAATVRLGFDNLMRPLAVPVTGGVLSSFVAFVLLMPSLSFRHAYGSEEPLAVATAEDQWGDPGGEIVGANARLESGRAVITGSEVSLTLLVDERGAVRDYYLSGGELTDDMKSFILLSKFVPATVSGQPTWGLKQIVFTRNGHRMRS